MTKKEKAIQRMERLANDNTHGYDQIYRWGEKGDYDCSSSVIDSWEKAGVPVKTNGATYTGNMYNVFTNCGFKDVTSKINLATGAGLKRGDVLLNTVHHTAMYCGDGKEVEASINEKGTAKGGKPGDQTGREFLIRSYRNYPWNKVLRFPENEWMHDSKGWWYKRSDGGYPVDCWGKIDGSWFYFDKHGYAVTGWQFIEGYWYFFDKNCYMKTGWQWIDDKCYYLGESGAMYRNYYIPSATTKHYYHWVGSDGAWIKSQDSWDITAYNHL